MVLLDAVSSVGCVAAGCLRQGRLLVCDVYLWLAQPRISIMRYCLDKTWQTWYSTSIGDSVTQVFAACRQAEHRLLPFAAAQGILAPA